jgi:hypothetical protein
MEKLDTSDTVRRLAASVRSRGSIKACEYCNVTPAPITTTIAVKEPKTPNAAGPYRRVMKGTRRMPMSCAPAVPDITVTTFRTNGRLIHARILSVGERFIPAGRCGRRGRSKRSSSYQFQVSGVKFRQLVL